MHCGMGLQQQPTGDLLHCTAIAACTLSQRGSSGAHAPLTPGLLDSLGLLVAA